MQTHDIMLLFGAALVGYFCYKLGYKHGHKKGLDDASTLWPNSN